MENKSKIIITIVLIAVAIFILPKLDIFSVYMNNLQFGHSIYAHQGTTNYDGVGDIDESYVTCMDEADCPYTTDPIRVFGARAYFDYSAEARFICNSDRTSCSTHHLGFDITQKAARVSGGKTYIPPSLNFYLYSLGKAEDTPGYTYSLDYPKVYYSLDSPFTCDANGCNGQLMHSGRADFTGGRDPPYFKYVMDLSNRVSNPNINSIYIGSYTKYRNDYSWFIIKIDTNLVVESSCTEGEIKQIGNEYYICRNAAFVKAYITDLSPEQQAAVMAQINALQATVEQKAAIIANLSDTIEGQVLMINQLSALTEEKARIIAQLSSNLTYQAQLISQMQLTVNQQVVTIQTLSSNITYQAQLIAQLQTNLNNKIQLIGLLQVENENQARMIREMNLSFANQAYIINQLSANITNDAVIIRNLQYNVQDQARLINELRLQRDQLAELVAAMNLSNGDTARLINELQLRVEDQIVIINQLNRSLEDERTIVEQLRLTIEEQNRIIEDLRNGVVPDSRFDVRTIWAENKWVIIGVAGILIAALLLGGKKRR